MHRKVWQATVYGDTKSQTRLRYNTGGHAVFQPPVQGTNPRPLQWGLNHWTTREVPLWALLVFYV